MSWDYFDSMSEDNLPTKFRMPKIDWYSGIGCLAIYIKLYNTIMRAHGLDKS